MIDAVSLPFLDRHSLPWMRLRATKVLFRRKKG
jgi:hypothetical protein